MQRLYWVTIARFLRRVRHHKVIGLGVILLMLGISILGNAVCFFLFEPDATLGNSLWYSVISITTIGYGDFSATTLGARIGTIVFIVVVGLATFSVFLGMVIDWVTDLSLREQRGMNEIIAREHVLIVNYPSSARVTQLIMELQSDAFQKGREIVVVADNIERMPMTSDEVLFVRGPVLEQETYQRACVENAKMAIVLATSYEDPNSDAIVASAIAVIDSMNPSIHIVAECLNERHRMLFDSVHCDAVVFSLGISGNLLAQEVHDPGVSQMIDVITSNVKGTTVFSTPVTGDAEVAYLDLAKQLLDRDINLICINRSDLTLTSFQDLKSQAGDRVIYAADRRMTWKELNGT